MKNSGATDISLLNAEADLELKILSLTRHNRTLLNRIFDILSETELKMTDGFDFWYKSHKVVPEEPEEVTRQIVARIET